MAPQKPGDSICPIGAPTMTTIHSFPPIARADARVLILGSMPGKRSLERNEYYAHPRNAFWPIAADILGFDVEQDYEARKRALVQSRAALWDVLRTCTRATSLDADIVESSVVANDFAGFLATHRRIGLICFNGAKAEQYFVRRVVPALENLSHRIETVRLPSTSPAHAALSFTQKLEIWRKALSFLTESAD